MSLGTLLLAIWVFLQSAAQLGWFSTNAVLVGVVGLLAAIMLMLEGTGVVTRLRAAHA